MDKEYKLFQKLRRTDGVIFISSCIEKYHNKIDKWLNENKDLLANNDFILSIRKDNNSKDIINLLKLITKYQIAHFEYSLDDDLWIQKLCTLIHKIKGIELMKIKECKVNNYPSIQIQNKGDKTIDMDLNGNIRNILMKMKLKANKRNIAEFPKNEESKSFSEQYKGRDDIIEDSNSQKAFDKKNFISNKWVQSSAKKRITDEENDCSKIAKHFIVNSFSQLNKLIKKIKIKNEGIGGMNTMIKKCNVSENNSETKPTPCNKYNRNVLKSSPQDFLKYPDKNFIHDINNVETDTNNKYCIHCCYDKYDESLEILIDITHTEESQKRMLSKFIYNQLNINPECKYLVFLLCDKFEYAKTEGVFEKINSKEIKKAIRRAGIIISVKDQDYERINILLKEYTKILIKCIVKLRITELVFDGFSYLLINDIIESNTNNLLSIIIFLRLENIKGGEINWDEIPKIKSITLKCLSLYNCHKISKKKIRSLKDKIGDNLLILQTNVSS